MTSDKIDCERRALDIVGEALELPIEDWARFVVEVAGGDKTVMERALAILAADPNKISALTPGVMIEGLLDDEIPARIGEFLIEREIGRGGMGSVFLGRKPTDDFKHLVAIKVVRTDSASPRLSERLRSERRTLARLKHPNIAQMYDGGETEGGAPYFVMEFVEGKPLADYLASERPALAERLRVFLDACDAVAYAHRNLIIHRDLSPANMLVSADGHVKLIDFGISRSLEDDNGSSTANLPLMTMTKGYSAPERMDGAAASTITDVYSLGVILKDLILGIDAPRKSDLEAIVAKAARDKPEERYQTVEAFADDIRAYESARPVSAVSGGWRYSMQRFVGRRPLAVSAAALGLLAAVITSVIMSVLYLRADAAERRAEARFNETRRLAGFLLFDLQDEVAKLDGSTKTRELLSARGVEYLDALSADPSASNELRLEIASGYKRLSDVVGNPGSANLSNRARSAELLQKADNQIAALLEASPNNTGVQRAWIDINFSKAMNAAFSENDMGKAASILMETRPVSETLVQTASATLSDRLRNAHIDSFLGFCQKSLSAYGDAKANIRLAIRKLDTLWRENPKSVETGVQLARAHVLLGEAIWWEEYAPDAAYESAAVAYDQGIGVSRKVLAMPDATLDAKTNHVVSLLKRGNTFCSVKPRTEEALSNLTEALDLAGKLSESDPENDRLFEQVTNIHIAMTECLVNLGRIDETDSALIEAIGRREARLARQPDNPSLLQDLSNTLHVAVSIYEAAGQSEKACQTSARIEDTWSKYDAVQSARDFDDHDERASNLKVIEDCKARNLL
ncbi:MAG: serine/threonine protein kinase [Parvularculaceae bacterium]